MTSTSAGRTIIVGVDGSQSAAAALRWALDEARLRGAPLRIIHVFPAVRSLTGSTGEEYYPQVEQEAKDELESILAGVPEVAEAANISREIRAGSPAEVLVELSRDADLLVVGSRGLGGFGGLVLGSVSAQCSQHAACPVVVVHHKG